MLTHTERRDRLVLRLRKDGRSISHIAGELGVTKARVRQIITRALRRQERAQAKVSPEEYLSELRIMGPAGRFYLVSGELGSLCTVYFLFSPVTGLVKIGSSIDPYARTEPMIATSSVPIYLLGYFVAQRRDEVLLHEQFAAEREHGEWFRLTPRLRAKVDELLSSNYAVRTGKEVAAC